MKKKKTENDVDYVFLQVPESSETNTQPGTPLEMASYEQNPPAKGEILRVTLL